MEKSPPIEHVENGTLSSDPRKDPVITEDVNDPKRNRDLNRRLDLRVLPLLCWVYLLNFLGTASSARSVLFR